MSTVIVEPVDAGWAVNVDGVENPMIFRSGRAAEQAGRDLAMRLAQGDRCVRLELRLRGGAVAARFMVLPPIDHDDDPLMVQTPPVPDRSRAGRDGDADAANAEREWAA